jgi:hypothetical protein
MVVSIISFARGNFYINAGKRLMKQAGETGLFNKSLLYTDDFLKEEPEFWSRHAEFIEKNPRGYGYYIWKPYLIKKYMEKMQDGDKLLWLDSGCEIDIRKKNILKQFLKEVETDYIIGSACCIEREYTKIDLILRLDMLDAKYLETFQRQGGAVLYLVCDKTRDLVNQWYDLCCDYHLVDDSPSTFDNLLYFKEHRHDQSIFSLLTKKYNLFSKHCINKAVCILRNSLETSAIDLNNIGFTYVTFVNNKQPYLNLMQSTIRSIERFSKYPIIVYCIDIPKEQNPFTESKHCIIRNLSQTACIGDKNIFYMKPYIIIDAIEQGLQTGYYIEADDLLTPNGDSIINYVKNLDVYPISPIDPDNKEISPAFMQHLKVVTKTQPYVHAHVLFKNTNLAFLKEWLANCLVSEGENWDESVLNCLYWKYKLTNHYLPLIDPYYTEFYNNDRLMNEVVTLHGCKNPEEHSFVLEKMTEAVLTRVSVIIPTYNRFKYLLNAIQSVKSQTHKNLEIIVVNDCSTQPDYYTYDWLSADVNMIHLKKNTKETFNYPCAAFVRNRGIQEAKGNYIAFCDDDDIWLPRKLELQLNAMKTTGCKMSNTDGYIGEGVYDENKHYLKYNNEYFYDCLQTIFKEKKSSILANGFPVIWTLDFLKIHNCMICSSVVIEKSILDKINNFNIIKPPGEDYDCWLRALVYTNSVYINEPCFYYDMAHGDGQHF